MDILTSTLEKAIREFEEIATPQLLERLFVNGTIEYYAEHGAHLEQLALEHILCRDQLLPALLHQAGYSTHQEQLGFFMPRFLMAMQEKYRKTR